MTNVADIGTRVLAGRRVRTVHKMFHHSFDEQSVWRTSNQHHKFSFRRRPESDVLLGSNMSGSRYLQGTCYHNWKMILSLCGRSSRCLSQPRSAECHTSPRRWGLWSTLQLYTWNFDSDLCPSSPYECSWLWPCSQSGWANCLLRHELALDVLPPTPQWRIGCLACPQTHTTASHCAPVLLDIDVVAQGLVVVDDDWWCHLVFCIFWHLATNSPGPQSTSCSPWPLWHRPQPRCFLFRKLSSYAPLSTFSWNFFLRKASTFSSSSSSPVMTISSTGSSKPRYWGRYMTYLNFNVILEPVFGSQRVHCLGFFKHILCPSGAIHHWSVMACDCKCGQVLQAELAELKQRR